MQGSYMYIKGTDIEVGVSRVSFDPMQPYALCRVRLGIKKKHLKSALTPQSMRSLKIPTVCLSKYPGIKCKKLTYDTLPIVVPEHLKPLFRNNSLTEGKYEEKKHKHDLYEVTSTLIGGKEYFMHLLKPLTPELAGIGNKVLSIFGIRGLTYRVKSFDEKNQIVTFDTMPVRRAHASVLRQTYTMEHLGGHTFRWEHTPKSLRTCKNPVDWGFIAGSNIHAMTSVYDKACSMYRVGKEFMRIPIEEITTDEPQVCAQDEDLVTVFPRVYLNGLPYPFHAKAHKSHPIHLNPIAFWLEEKKKYPYAEYSKTMQAKHAGIFLFRNGNKWKAHVKNLTLHPEYPLLEGDQKYIQDFEKRCNDLKRTKVFS